jgi:DNA polymerase V
MFAIADCNNFFVSCERVFRPDLAGKPVMVLSGNDGCVVARSNEVKALGIKMGVPLFQVKDLVEKHDITLFSSNFSLYGDLSDRVMHILEKYTSCLEQYSIDEAFLTFPDNIPVSQLTTLCRNIRREVLRGVGIPISLGIAPTRTLAKTASHFAKKHKGYKGVCAIFSDIQRRKALSLTPIGDVWGIGRKTRDRLLNYGINTALDFADKTETFVRQLLTKPGVMTWRELKGESCILFNDVAQKQSITRSRTFATAVNKLEDMEKHIADFCAACAVRLRAQHSVCQQMIVYAMPSRFRDEQHGAYIRALIQMPVATANSQEIITAALGALRKQFRDNGAYKSAGVILLAIAPDNSVQQSLFDTHDRTRENKLQQTIDTLNNTMGKNTIRWAVQLDNNNNTTFFHTDHLSPRYTTDINQIFTIKV